MPNPNLSDMEMFEILKRINAQPGKQGASTPIAANQSQLSLEDVVNKMRDEDQSGLRDFNTPRQDPREEAQDEIQDMMETSKVNGGQMAPSPDFFKGGVVKHFDQGGEADGDLDGPTDIQLPPAPIGPSSFDVDAQGPDQNDTVKMVNNAVVSPTPSSATPPAVSDPVMIAQMLANLPAISDKSVKASSPKVGGGDSSGSRMQDIVSAAANTPPTDYSFLSKYSAEARNALLQNLLKNQTSTGNLVANGAAGLGDAIARSYGHQNTDYQQNVIKQGQNATANAMDNFDANRKAALQDYQTNQMVKGDDSSSLESQMARKILGQLAPNLKVPDSTTYNQVGKIMPWATKIIDAQLAAESRHLMMQQQLDKADEQKINQFSQEASGWARGQGAIGAEYKRMLGGGHLLAAINSGYDPKTGKIDTNTFTAPEVAMALANISSGGNAPSVETFQSMNPPSLHQSVAKSLAYITGNPDAINSMTQDQINTVLNLATRQIKQSEQYIGNAMNTRVSGLGPSASRNGSQVDQIVDQTKQNFPSAMYPQFFSNKPKPMTAKNAQTGQRIQSLDGGKTWQPLQ